MARLTLSLEKWIWPCSGARGGVAREEFVGIIQATNDGTSVDRAASEQGLIPDRFMVSISRVGGLAMPGPRTQLAQSLWRWARGSVALKSPVIPR